MRAVFDSAELLVLLRDFYELTGLRTVVFDAWGADILSYPQELPRFCRLVRAAPGGAVGCHLCDQNACRLARREKEPVVYACHAGLIEVITPILVDGATAGYLLLCHIVQGADEAAEWALVQQRCAPYAIPAQSLRAAYDALPRTPHRTLRAACDLLSLAARSLYRDRLARLAPGSPEDRLNRFLAEHLAEELSSERICRALSISRTALYHLSKEAYGCGISDHIARLRVQKAAQLLAETALSNSEICRQVGIRDYNYFFRVFRRHTGVTPRMYREKFSAGGAEAASSACSPA